MKKGGLRFDSMSSGNSCGFNPFCHISRFFGSIFSFLILGCLLCSIGYCFIFQPSRQRAKWLGETKVVPMPIPPCCEDICKCSSVDFPNVIGQECCQRDPRGGNVCSSEITPTCTKKCIDPCFNCKKSRKYELNNQTATKTYTIERQAKCDSTGFNSPIYANPNNIYDTASIATGDSRRMGLSSITAGGVLLVIFISILFVLFKSGQFLANSFS